MGRTAVAPRSQPCLAPRPFASVPARRSRVVRRSVRRRTRRFALRRRQRSTRRSPPPSTPGHPHRPRVAGDHPARPGWRRRDGPLDRPALPPLPARARPPRSKQPARPGRPAPARTIHLRRGGRRGRAGVGDRPGAALRRGGGGHRRRPRALDGRLAPPPDRRRGGRRAGVAGAAGARARRTLRGAHALARRPRTFAHFATDMEG